MGKRPEDVRRIRKLEWKGGGMRFEFSRNATERDSIILTGVDGATA